MALALGFGLSTPRFTGEDFSVLFNGSNHKIDYTTNDLRAILAEGEANFKASGSVSVWARVETTGANGQLFDFCVDENNRIQTQYKHQADGFTAIYKAGGTAKTATFNPSGTQEGDGNFHHIVQTWDGEDLKLYYDGALKTTTDMSGVTFAGDYSDAAGVEGVEIVQGVSFNDNADYLGYLDDLAVYSGVLDLSQVQTIYNSGKAGPIVKTNLVAFWRFNEGSGSTVTSEIGGYTGTLTGATFNKINASQ
tara:strand:- start:51 stop:800 length:750 start_codon:yes stop_codon:yes gene_type:complete